MLAKIFVIKRPMVTPENATNLDDILLLLGLSSFCSISVVHLDLPSVLLDDNAARVDSVAPSGWYCNGRIPYRRRPCEWERRMEPGLEHGSFQRLALARPSARQLGD